MIIVLFPLVRYLQLTKSFYSVRSKRERERERERVNNKYFSSSASFAGFLGCPIQSFEPCFPDQILTWSYLISHSFVAVILTALVSPGGSKQELSSPGESKQDLVRLSKSKQVLASPGEAKQELVRLSESNASYFGLVILNWQVKVWLNLLFGGKLVCFG